MAESDSLLAIRATLIRNLPQKAMSFVPGRYGSRNTTFPGERWDISLLDAARDIEPRTKVYHILRIGLGLFAANPVFYGRGNKSYIQLSS
jgi:hypothetical protein